MGYDCTLHVVDARAIREVFVPALLGKAADPTPFDELPDAVELRETVRRFLRDEPPERAASVVSQLALVWSGAALPYQYHGRSEGKVPLDSRRRFARGRRSG